MIYTVTMNPAIDCHMTVDRLTGGAVNRADAEHLRFGGKGINVSYALREFGCDVTLTGFIGGFTGKALACGLEDEGFACDFAELSSGNTRINVKLSSPGGGDPDTELNAAGPTPTADELSLLKSKLAEVSPCDTVILAGSLPSGVSADFIKDIMELLPSGTAVVCDLSGDALRTAICASPALVKPNIHELFELFGVPGTPDNLADRSLIVSCAEKITEMGAGALLITMGDSGAYYKGAACSGFVPCPKIKKADRARSAVGCGDSAVAGWLIGEGYGGETARELALECAGISPNDEMAAAKLAVSLGSASYYFGFPPSPEKIMKMRG